MMAEFDGHAGVDGDHDTSMSPLLVRDTLGNAKDTQPSSIDAADVPLPRFMYLFVPLVAIGGLLFGFDTGVVSGALVKITDDLHLTETQQELVVSLTVAGAIVGAVCGGWLANAFGRRPVILVSSSVFTVGAFLMGFAPSLAVLLLGRAVVGVGIGMTSMVVPLYLAEVSSARYRGMLVTLNVVFLTGGQLVASLVDGAFADTPHGWRWMLGLSGLPSGIQLIGFLFMPESPRWLLLVGRDAEATAVLRRTRGLPPRGSGGDGAHAAASAHAHTHTHTHTHTHAHAHAGVVPAHQRDDEAGRPGDDDPLEVAFRQELCDLRAAVVAGQEQMTVLQVLQDRTLRRPLIVGVMMQVIQQLAGINLVMYYSGTILRAAGFSSNSAIWLAALVASVNFIGSIVGMLLVDRVGRRPLTLWSLGAVAVMLALLAGVFYGRDTNSASCVAYDAAVAAPAWAGGLMSAAELTGSRASLHDCQAAHLCVECVAVTGCGFFGNATGGVCVPGNSSVADVALPWATHPTWRWQWGSCDGLGLWSSLSVVGLMLYLLAFSPGMGSMPWQVNSEIYPRAAAAAANSISTMANWTSNFVVSMSFLALQSAITSYGTFFLYSGIAVLAWVFFYRRLPETKGVALEDTTALFNK